MDIRRVLRERADQHRLLLVLPAAAGFLLDDSRDGAGRARARPPELRGGDRRVHRNRYSDARARPLRMGAARDGGRADADRDGHGGGRVPALRARSRVRRPRRLLDCRADGGRVCRDQRLSAARAARAATHRCSGRRRNRDSTDRQIRGHGADCRAGAPEFLLAGIFLARDGGAGRAAGDHRARGAERAGDHGAALWR